MPVLDPHNGSYRVVTKVTIVQPSVSVLTSKSNGWRDLAVGLRGGGILIADEAKLSFDGANCPSNPSVPLAQRLTHKMHGKVVVPANVFDLVHEQKAKPVSN
jgi:hypothetical protein